MIKERRLRTLAEMTKLEHRIWENVQIIDDNASCWLWTASTDKAGYPVLGTKMCWDEELQEFHPVLDSQQGDGGVSKTVNARRLVLFLINGYMPVFAQSTCDQRACLRPSHLVDAA